MDGGALLEEAVFNLTPTRTRCDLIAVGRDGSREKIASGLLDPFLSHLRSFRDQIPKAGYSFSLRSPSAAAAADWFSVRTVRLFVRFVASPEILERIATIETEIVHIEDEIERADLSSAAVVATASSEASGENSKHALVLVLENRKKMLQKEQGMAYARASIAGYEKSRLNHLIMFADAFGASRLREACINFKELCIEKEKDELWMEELAALEASGHPQLSSVQTSGIMLSSETENKSSFGHTNAIPDGVTSAQHVPTHGDFSQSKHQVPMGWMPEYMYGFHGPMAPFQGYPHPGMQFIPPYSLHSMNTKRHSYGEECNSSNGHDADHDIEHKHRELTSESDDIGPFDKNQKQKQSNKKSSRKVVIRNINYISKGRQSDNDESEESSTDDEFVDENFLRREVEDIVGSFEKHRSSKTKRHHRKSKSGKRNFDVLDTSDVVEEMKNVASEKTSNDGWGAFQNILMKDEPNAHNMPQKVINSSDEDKQQHMDIVDGYYTIKSNSLSTPSTYDCQQIDDEHEIKTIPKVIENDPIVMNGQHISCNGGKSLQRFEYDDDQCQGIMRKQNDNEEFLLKQRNMTPVSSMPTDFSNFNDKTEMKSSRDGDWFVVSEYATKSRSEAASCLSFEAELSVENHKDRNHKEKRVEDPFIDDSIVVPERSLAGEKTFSLMETDMSVISGFAVDNDPSRTSKQRISHVLSNFHEPNDLQMLFERGSVPIQQISTPTPAVDFSADMNYTSNNQKNPVADPDISTTDEKPIMANKNVTIGKPKFSRNEKKPNSLYGSLAKSRSEVVTRNRKLTNMNKETIQRTKAQMEEENRKRLEALAVERQKRIAQRSSNGSTSIATKQSKTEAKTAMNSSKPVKKIIQSKTQETKTFGMENLQISPKVPRPAGSIRKI